MSRIVLLALTVFLAVAAFAQSSRTPALPPQDAPNLPVEKIGPDDLIGIFVYDSPELTRSVRVAADGTFLLPMLKDTIVAAGLYPNDLAKTLAAALKSQRVMVNPIVSVSVVEYRSRPINVVGAVNSPATFQSTGVVTLLDAITRAGGLSANAGPEILVTHSKTTPGQPNLVRRITVRDLIRGSDSALNLRLEGGEEVRVPEAERVFVVGNVKQPGSFLIQDGAESSVLKALALSQGLLPFAGKTAYIYRTDAGSGPRSEIPVRLHDIISRKAPDVPLYANDIMYIPDNTGRRTALNTLQKILLIGSGLGGAAVYAVSR